MKYDYIVVGQGLAGTLLAFELVKHNKKVLIFSHPTQISASSVAGGMYNPVTGKYLKKTWLDEEILPFMTDYYTGIEQRFNVKLLYLTELFRPFVNQESKDYFLSQIEKNNLKNYIEVIENTEEYTKHYDVPMGGMLTKNAGWVDVPLLLAVLKVFLKQNATYFEDIFEYKNLKITDWILSYDDRITADKIVFCEGFFVKDNPWFNILPFNPVKGETLIGHIDDYEIDKIINRGNWVMPIAKNKVRVGATYNWDNLDFETTQEAQDILLGDLKKYLISNFTIENQQAGVRPSTQDRRPIVGYHPVYKNLLIFNGLGTKGVSLAPYFIQQFIEMLFFGKEINSEISIDRFLSLYS